MAGFGVTESHGFRRQLSENKSRCRTRPARRRGTLDRRNYRGNRWVRFGAVVSRRNGTRRLAFGCCAWPPTRLGRPHGEVERVAWHHEIERQPPLARPSVEVELMPMVVWARLQSSDEPVEVMANCFWKFAGEESPFAGLPEIGIQWLRERARQRAHCFIVCAWEAPV